MIAGTPSLRKHSPKCVSHAYNALRLPFSGASFHMGFSKQGVMSPLPQHILNVFLRSLGWRLERSTVVNNNYTLVFC